MKKPKIRKGLKAKPSRMQLSKKEKEKRKRRKEVEA